ncbi:MAG TPA: PspC domain-containing protein, partial [Solirubrobacteraceae bacterium]|nr:PspC domain-containing protein [Solirubrobacteraceae bacterium]
MTDTTASPSGRTAAPARDLRRDPANGIVAGVCEGIGRRLDVDPLLLRIVFVATTLASGLGIVAYLLAWWLLPAEAREQPAAAPRAGARDRLGALEVGLGVGCLVVAILLAFRALGLPVSDALTWPLVLVAAGGALIWRQSVGRSAAPRRSR